MNGSVHLCTIFPPGMHVLELHAPLLIVLVAKQGYSLRASYVLPLHAARLNRICFACIEAGLVARCQLMQHEAEPEPLSLAA